MISKKRLISTFAILTGCTALFFNSCSNDVLPMPTEPECADTLTYTQHLQPIIASSCAISGCHDGSGSAPGDFRNYATMLSRLDNGIVEARVITQMDMPIAPASLSADEFDQFKCWLEQGHQE